MRRNLRSLSAPVSWADFNGMSDNLGAGIDGGGGILRGGCGLSASEPLGPFSRTTLSCTTLGVSVPAPDAFDAGEGDAPLLLLGLRYSRLRVRVNVRYVGV